MIFRQIISVVVDNPEALRKWATKELLVFLIYMAAAALTLNVFMQTRSFEEGSGEFGLASMLDGSAHRPYVYRQLIPIIANNAVELIHEQDREAFVQYHLDKYHLKQQYFGRAKFQNKGMDDWTPSYALKFHIIYAVNFLSLLGLAYLLRYLARDGAVELDAISIMAPVVFLILLPLSFMHGNFYYDFLELFFLAALLLSAMSGKFTWWILLLPLAVLNKESNILVPILYLPVICCVANRRYKTLMIVGLGTSLAAAAYFYTKASYANNLGGETVWQLWKNIDFWLNPKSYFLWQDFYIPGIPFPRGLNLILVLMLLSLISIAWKKLAPRIKALLVVAFVVNIPLWLLFCQADEMRNLSFVFLPLFLVATKAAAELIKGPILASI